MCQLCNRYIFHFRTAACGRVCGMPHWDLYQGRQVHKLQALWCGDINRDCVHVFTGGVPICII